MEKHSPQLNNLLEFEYEKTAVLAGNYPPGEMIAIRPICENLKIDRKWQQRKIQEHSSWGQLGGNYPTIGKDGKSYQMYCLPPTALQDWLYSIQIEHCDQQLLDVYRKGLVINLLLMLKISLNELNRLRSVEGEFDVMKQAFEQYVEKIEESTDLSKKARDAKKEADNIKTQIFERMKNDPNQLKLSLN